MQKKTLQSFFKSFIIKGKKTTSCRYVARKGNDMKNNTPIRENNMISPPMDTLTHQGEFNRYELVIATAKGARVVTEEYIEMRSKAEKMKSDKETDKPLLSLIDGEYRDQKPVRIAITRLQDGKYSMERPAEEEETETEGVAEAEAPAEEG